MTGRPSDSGPHGHLPMQHATRSSSRRARTRQLHPRPEKASPRTRAPSQGVYPPSSGHHPRVTSPPSVPPAQAAYHPNAQWAQMAVCPSSPTGVRTPAWAPAQVRRDQCRRTKVGKSPTTQRRRAVCARVRPSAPSAPASSAAAGARWGCYKISTALPGAPAADEGWVRTVAVAAAAVVSAASVPRGKGAAARGFASGPADAAAAA